MEIVLSIMNLRMHSVEFTKSDSSMVPSASTCPVYLSRDTDTTVKLNVTAGES